MNKFIKFLSLMPVLSSCAISLVNSMPLQFSDPREIATNACTSISLDAALGSRNTWVAAENTAVTLTGLGRGYAYSNLADCKTGLNATSTFFVSSGGSSVSFYFRSAVAEELTLVATARNLGSVSLSTRVRTFEVLGQPSGSRNFGNEMGLASPTDVKSDGVRFYVVDNANHRVLIWNTVPTTSQASPDIVVGQPSLTSVLPNAGGISASTLNGPKGVYSDGTHLFVTDTGNNRLLIWNTIPTTHGKAADLVIGQPDFISSTANNGGITGSSLNNPAQVTGNGTHLYVSDNSNHRILVWNVLPTSTFQAADLVLGQAIFTTNASNSGGLSASSLRNPYGVYTDGTRLFAADSNNNRVLIWSTLPTVSNQGADLVLGQPNFTTALGNNGGGISANGLFFPQSVFYNSNQFFVSDFNNTRILMWNSLPTINQQAADIALGATDLVSAGTGTLNASSINIMYSISGLGNRLFLADTLNNRVKIYNSIPMAHYAAADLVLGQPGFTTSTTNYPGAGPKYLQSPRGLYSNGSKFFAADSVNNRVLIWNSFPKTDTQLPDLVLGQPDLVSTTANNGGVSASSLSGPYDVFAVGNKLFVADFTNHRVLIWNSIPTSNGQPADVALGQPDLVSNTFNNGGRTASTMRAPSCVYSDGTRLFVSDNGNHRVLIWNTIPTITGAAADLELGQPDFITGTVNAGGLSNVSLRGPTGITIVGTRLFVSDTTNHRVLIWNTLPTVMRQAADVVLGQALFTTATLNNGGISLSSFSSPAGITYDGARLMVVNQQNHRISVWNSLPTTNNQAADYVLGQADGTTNTVNYYGYSSSSLSTPINLLSDGTRIFVSDSGNNRILVLPIPGI